MRSKGSRMAYIGSNTLSNSSLAQDPENYQIPTYSAFNGRDGIGGLLKDFYHEVSSLKGTRRNKQMPVNNVREHSKSVGRRANTLESHAEDTKSVASQPDIIDRVQMIQPKVFTQPKKSQGSMRRSNNQSFRQDSGRSLENQKIMVQLNHLKDKLNQSQALRMQQMQMYQPYQTQPVRSSQLQQKMLDCLMRLSNQPQNNGNQPIIIQSPPPYYPPQPQYFPPPPQYPYPPPYQPTPPTPPISKQPSVQLPKKDTKLIRKRLRKVFWAVAFPFLLKAYSKKLRVVRKQYLTNNLGSLLQQSVDLIKQWFLKASSKSLGMLTTKIDISLQFDKQVDKNMAEQKMKCVTNLINNIMNNLQKTSNSQTIRQFLPFISVTCDNRSFNPADFITNKQLEYIAFSDQHQYQLLYPDLQMVQITLFVFIKCIVYNILFQPWRFDKNLKKQPVVGNLSLIGYILYYCTDQLINQKLKNVKPKKYHAGNMKGINTPYPLIYDKTLPYQQDKISFLHCIKSSQFIQPIKQYKRGDVWRQWKNQINRISTKLHKQMIKKRPILSNTFKQLQVKYDKEKSQWDKQESDQDYD